MECASERTVELNAGQASVRFNGGKLCALCAGDTVIPCEGLFTDVGAEGAWQNRSLAFESFLDFNTWSLPRISPTGKLPEDSFFAGWENDLPTFGARIGALEIRQLWSKDCGLPRLDVRVKNVSGRRQWINGLSLSLSFAAGGLSFDFPGNVPYGVFRADALEELNPVETGLVTAVTHFSGPEGQWNVIFIDPMEKWATGVYRRGESLIWTAVAGTELFLEAGGEFLCGSLYLQALPTQERFEPIRRFYREKGWRVPQDGVKDSVVYSGHPSGPWDANFPFRDTLAQYGDYLGTIARLGADTVWLLPIFDHREEADPERYLYAPTDQSRIDPRYGTDEDVRAYVERARSLGARVIFDYVPHGPRPQDPLGRRHFEDWASRRQDGTAQMEWTCLSFDMANPTYQAYMKDLVKDHIARFGIGGTRIDCAMGGLSNWRPYPGNRPSCSNMQGGVAMAHALREAFTEKGISPFVTPENFHPIPLYAGCTDAYYDMALYRTLYDLNRAGLTAREYVFELTRWLEAQMLSMPEGMNKLRFLGNHDTVSWVWDARRPIAVYGVERAKAMWVLISLIDGCPMIYQGDEDPRIYLNETQPQLLDFFAELFAAKKAHTSHEYETQYEYTGSEVFAFCRVKGEDRKRVLINLGDTERSVQVGAGAELLYGTGTVQEDCVLLPSCGYAMLRVGSPESNGNGKELTTA